MIICPNCNNKIKFKKIILLNNFNRIQCPHCGKYLIVNEIRGALIGGIGGGVGSIVLIAALYDYINKNFGIKNIIFIILWLVGLVVVCYFFTKLEVDFYND